MQDWRENNMVEWKKLDDVCTFKRGRTITAKDAIKGTVPVIAGGQTPSYYHNESNRTGESITVAGSGAYAGFVAYWNQPIFVSDAFTVEPAEGILHKYVFHWLRMNQQRIFETQKGAGVPHVHGKDIAGFVIPIPSLSEQTRIVGILDTFTASIENLKQQIAERRKQYEHYRDQLLDLEGKEGVARIILKDVCEVINGRAYSQPELLSEGKYRVLRVGNFFSNDSWYYSDLELEDKYYCESGDLLYAWSASFGPHIWEEEKVIYHYHIWKMNCGEGLNKKYMYYWLQSEDMKRQAFTNLHGATMAHLTKALMESLMVPVPSIEEQSRIVSILDTFEASIANLEAQLKQREKQYEYYRNKLLTFD